MNNEENKELHIDVIDFKGNRITCSLEEWLDHIANDRRNHDLSELEDVVVASLQKPFSGIRFYDVDYPNRMSYYGYGITTRYIKVSIKFNDNTCTGDGVIVTAYPTNNMKPHEIPEM